MSSNMSDDDGLFLTQSTFKEPDVDEGDFAFRFGKPLTEDDLEKKLEICVPRSTRYKNDWAKSVFKRWQEERRQRSIGDNNAMIITATARYNALSHR